MTKYKVLASDKLWEKRLKTCLECELRNKALNTCPLCKCWVPTKTAYLGSKCPDKRWQYQYFYPKGWRGVHTCYVYVTATNGELNQVEYARLRTL